MDPNEDDVNNVEAVGGNLDEMIELEDSPLYIATQITVLNRLLPCLERQCERNKIKRKEILKRKRKEKAEKGTLPKKKSHGSKEGAGKEDSSDDEEDSSDEDDETEEIEDPVLYHVLKSIKPGMDRTLKEIEGTYDKSEIQLKKLVTLKKESK
jgi:hypothetical protein